MIGLGKCDSCSNKVICKFVEKMKEYEDGVQKNVIGEHTHVVGFFPISVNVDCESYKTTCLSKDTGTIRGGINNTECGLEYIRHEFINNI